MHLPALLPYSGHYNFKLIVVPVVESSLLLLPPLGIGLFMQVHLSVHFVYVLHHGGHLLVQSSLKLLRVLSRTFHLVGHLEEAIRADCLQDAYQPFIQVFIHFVYWDGAQWDLPFLWLAEVNAPERTGSCLLLDEKFIFVVSLLIDQVLVSFPSSDVVCHSSEAQEVLDVLEV